MSGAASADGAGKQERSCRYCNYPLPDFAAYCATCNRYQSFKWQRALSLGTIAGVTGLLATFISMIHMLERSILFRGSLPDFAIGLCKNDRFTATLTNGGNARTTLLGAYAVQKILGTDTSREVKRVNLVPADPLPARIDVDPQQTVLVRFEPLATPGIDAALAGFTDLGPYELQSGERCVFDLAMTFNKQPAVFARGAAAQAIQTITHSCQCPRA